MIDETYFLGPNDREYPDSKNQKDSNSNTNSRVWDTTHQDSSSNSRDWDPISPDQSSKDQAQDNGDQAWVGISSFNRDKKSVSFPDEKSERDASHHYEQEVW